eukprot:gene8833-781_t
MSVEKLVPVVQDFKKKCHGNPTEAQEILTTLKKEFIKFKTFLPVNGQIKNLTEDEKREIVLVRETLEFAILLASQVKDMKSFERHMAQVKTYYNFNLVEKSERELLIHGLNLLRLLSQHKLAEFHTELELIPVSLHSNMYIKYAIDTDFSLMEGSYNKLLQLNNPAEEYGIFKEILLETVREVIAECSEKAYNSLKLQEAQQVLLFKTEQDTKNYISKRNWKVDNSGVIQFAQVQKQELPFEQSSKQLISKTLSYAKEMERII